MQNVQNKHLKDVRNVKVFGIVQEIVKLLIGLNTKVLVIKKLKS